MVTKGRFIIIDLCGKEIEISNYRDKFKASIDQESSFDIQEQDLIRIAQALNDLILNKGDKK